MPFDRPTLTELRRAIASDVAAGLPGGLLRYSNIGILGDGLAGLVSGLYGYLDWLALQGVPFTAQDEYLDAWAALKGVTRKPAAAAAGRATFTGVEGTDVALGTLLLRGDGASFVTTAAGAIVAGMLDVPVVAVTAGAAGNTAAGAALTIGSSISGIAAAVTVGAAIAGGSDVEDDDDFRSRMLAAYASPPRGGAAADYVEWALAVPAVTRAWAIGGAMGAGSVSVYFMMDDARADRDGFPLGADGVAANEVRGPAAAGDQLVVADAIYPERPVTALVYAVAPGRNDVGFTIAGLPGATTATRAAIIAAIRTALTIDAAPGGVSQLSTIEAAIARVPTAAGFVVTGMTASAGTIAPGPVGNVTADAGHLNALGAVTWA